VSKSSQDRQQRAREKIARSQAEEAQRRRRRFCSPRAQIQLHVGTPLVAPEQISWPAGL
jgi:hypothetical protein